MKYSTLRLISGAYLIGGLLLSNSVVLRCIITIFFIILASSSGRKFKFLPNFILLISISLAHTLSPHGLVLFTIGNFPVTLGAIIIGAHKGLLLISFIYASHYMMSCRPHIPGKLGSLISLQFYYFDRLTTMYSEIEKKRPFIEAIDQLLLHIDTQSQEISVEQHEQRIASKKDFITHSIHMLIMTFLLLLFSDVAKGVFPIIGALP